MKAKSLLLDYAIKITNALIALHVRIEKNKRRNCMKVTRLSLLAVATLTGIALGGCNKKSNSGTAYPLDPGTSAATSTSGGGATSASGDSGAAGSSSTSAPGPVYTVSEAEYLLAKSKFTSPRIFLDGNFTFSGYMEMKFASGVVYSRGVLFDTIFDFDVASYNSGTGNVDCEQYNYEDGEWSHLVHSVNLNDMFGGYEIYLFTGLLSSINDYSYNEETHKYSGTNTEHSLQYIIGFENVNLVSVRIVSSEMDETIEISDYGTTTVEIPELL